MTKSQAEILLAAVILSRATSYLFTKMGLQSLGVFNLLAVRFLLAFLLLTLIFSKNLRRLPARTVLHGAILGGVFFLVMTLELTALKTTDTSKVSFLENTAIIFVPLIEALLFRRFPKAVSVLSALSALCGVALLTLSDGVFRFAPGELLALCAALLYATAIILTDRFSHRDEALLLGIVQVGSLGLYALVASLVFESPRLPTSAVEWGAVLMLAVVCTGFGFTLQPVAQSRLDVERAGLFCALNPAFASVLGVVFLSEPVTTTGVLGAAFILLSLLIPHLAPTVRRHAPALYREKR